MAAAAVLVGVSLVSAGPASPASARATGISATTSGPTINVLGQSVTLPHGVAVLVVEGDDLYIKRVEVGYEGEPASNLQFSWTLEDSHGNVVAAHGEPEDSGPDSRLVRKVSWPVEAEAADSGKLCGHIRILDAPAGTSCVNIYRTRYFWDGLF